MQRPGVERRKATSAGGSACGPWLRSPPGGAPRSLPGRRGERDLERATGTGSARRPVARRQHGEQPGDRAGLAGSGPPAITASWCSNAAPSRPAAGRGSAGPGVRKYRSSAAHAASASSSTPARPEIGGDGHRRSSADPGTGHAIDHQRFDKIPVGRRRRGERVGQDPAGPAVLIGPRRFHRAGRHVSGVARQRGRSRSGSGPRRHERRRRRPLGGWERRSAGTREPATAEIDADVPVQRARTARAAAITTSSAAPPCRAAARPQPDPDRTDSTMVAVTWTSTMPRTPPDERLEDGHRRRDGSDRSRHTTLREVPVQPGRLSSTTGRRGDPPGEHAVGPAVGAGPDHAPDEEVADRSQVDVGL